MTSLDTAWQIIKRKNSNGGLSNVNCPTALSLYTAKMRGTDVFDQIMMYYLPKIRSIKWYVKVFAHLFHIAVINSHILYKQYHNITRENDLFELSSYIIRLMNELGHLLHNIPIIPNISKKRKTATLEHDENKLIGTHTPYNASFRRLDNDEIDHVNQRRVCRYCKESRTNVICLQCNVALHIESEKQNDCFQKYHTKQELPK